MTDNQERENFYHISYVHKGFISAVCLLNDLMKILDGLDVFNHVIFKDLGSDCYRKKKETNICCFEYDFKNFHDFTLKDIAISQYNICRKQIKKCFFPKMRHFCTAKQLLTKKN